MAQPEPDDYPLQPGDFVTISTGNGYPLTWTILSIITDKNATGATGPLAVLESGQTSRKRYEPVANLTRFTPKGTP